MDRIGVVRMQLQDNALHFIAALGDGQNQSTAAMVSDIRDTLRPGNLNEANLEAAIAQVEDLIMPILRQFPARANLEIGGAELDGVFRMLSAKEDEAVSIESVERLFNQLADHASGSPVAWRPSLPPAQIALGLVVLREVMHHGRYRSVSLFPLAG